MSHAKSLRVIGQALEAAGVPTFEIEKYGPQYMVWSASVSFAGEAQIRKALRQESDPSGARQTSTRVFCFGTGDISRLDAEARLGRGRHNSWAAPPEKLLSHGLRTLGDHFDRMEVQAFRIDWTLGSVIVDFQRASAGRNCASLSFADLRRLCELAKGNRHDLAMNLLLV